jgi:hypothetical protein
MNWIKWIEGRIEMTGRRGRRRKQLLNDLKEKRRYCKLKEKALDRTLWRSRFGRGYGPVVRQTTGWMNEYYFIINIPKNYSQNMIHVIGATRHKDGSTHVYIHTHTHACVYIYIHVFNIIFLILLLWDIWTQVLSQDWICVFMCETTRLQPENNW